MSATTRQFINCLSVFDGLSFAVGYSPDYKTAYLFLDGRVIILLMNSRERVLRSLSFQPVDRPAYDLMEGCVWPELQEYFRRQYGLETYDQVIEFLDPDFRWTFLNYRAPEDAPPPPAPPEAPPGPDHRLYSKTVAAGPLAQAETIADIERYPLPDPSAWYPADYGLTRARFPNHALVFCPGWMPLFWTACEAFGMESALVNLAARPVLFEAFIQRYHAFCMDILRRGARGASGCCDLALLGDDFAHQGGMLISPAMWRRQIKPCLAEQVRVLRENGLLVLFHSCGAVRPILPDLIDIGINALLVFQTTARGMEAPSIAREFGGKLAFYGGIDIQHLLSSGTPAQVAAAVQANLAAFAGCGGYIVANSHHTEPSIRGANLVAMCQGARTYPGDQSWPGGP